MEIVSWSRRLLLRHSGLHREDHLPLAKQRVNPVTALEGVSAPVPPWSSRSWVFSQCDWSSTSSLDDNPFILDNYISVLSHALPVFFASVRGIGLYSLSWDWERVIILLLWRRWNGIISYIFHLDVVWILLFLTTL